MMVRRYSGTSLSELQQTVEREMGKDAVIAHIEKRRPAKKWLAGFSVEYAVVAVAEESCQPQKDTGEENEDKFETMYEEQRRQYRGMRRSIRMVDEKLVDLGESVGKLTESLKGVNPFVQTAKLNGNTNAGMTQFAQLASPANGEDGKEEASQNSVDQISVSQGIDFTKHQDKPAVYLFTGPTGVGKTTTLAKLAADCVITQRLNVGLITVDTYRVGGCEQLRQYADLLGVPLKVAFSATELKNYVSRFQDKDVVFVDTPGRSQFDRTGIDSIQDTLSKFGQPNSFLLVSANVRKQDAETIYAGYGRMDPDSLIVTKADEATVCDGLSELCALADVPVSYVTDGQRVPEDIKTASSEYIASLAASSS